MEDNSTYNLRPSQRKSKREKRFTFSHVLIAWLLCLLVFNFFLYFHKKRKEFNAKKKEISTLQNEISELKQKKTRLEGEIYFLNTDKGVEDTARKKLGLVKKNEIAVIVLDEKNRKIENPETKQEAKAENKVKSKSDGVIDKILKFLHIIK